MVANDYRRFNYTAYAYRTKDYGKTWSRIVDNNDVESYALSIVEDIENKNLLFLGTDDGLYISFDGATSWQKWTEDFPTVSIKDLVIHPREHDLVIGTFGRAAWVLDDIRPLRALAGNSSILNVDAKVFTPPTAYQAAYQQPTGSRFGADAMFIGVTAVDYSGYPDCRPEYINAFETMANLATKAGIEGKKLHIETPLIDLSKAEIIKLGHGLGFDYGMTVSCYQADDKGQACGHCDSCHYRKQGFEQAGIADPTRYA